MKNLVCIMLVFYLLPTGVLQAQSFSKEDALSDLRFFNAALKNGHGGNYRADSSLNIDALIRDFEQTEMDSIAPLPYYLLLNQAIKEARCIHTSIQSAPFLERLGPRTYFPLYTKFVDGKLFALYQPDSTLTEFCGREILYINGLSSDSLWTAARMLRADDGNSGAFGAAFTQLAASSILAFLCERPDTFDLVFADTTARLPASGTFMGAPKPENDSLKRSMEWDGNLLRFVKPRVAYLKLSRFKEAYLSRIPEVFDSIKKHNTTDLIIDLRNNPGGKRTAGVILTQFLVDSSFAYTILQPKLTPYPYLSFNGKLAYLSSKLMYNVGDYRKMQDTETGKAFVYTYPPVPTEKRYTGKLYILTDGITASTSTMFTTWMQLEERAVFIGSQPGGGYNGNNGGSFPSILLPKSKTRIRFPLYHLTLDPNSSIDEGLQPDYPITHTPEDLLSGRDVALETALDLIEK